MTIKNNFVYSRKIKLSPAIGDWTTIQYRNTDFEEINISPVTNINFDSLPKNQLNYVHYLHYRLAEKITKKLSVDLDIKVELHTIVATQIAYQDFLNSQLVNKVIQTDFYIEKVGRVNVLFEWDLADMMVNRLVGGKGEESKSEHFTDLEVSVLRTQVEQFQPYFVKAWKPILSNRNIDLSFQVGQYVHDKKITLREAYILFSFYFYFGKGDLRKITVAYPNPVLKRLLYLKGNIEDPLKKRVELHENTLEKIKLEVKGKLGNVSLTMQEMKNLQVGDIVPLDQTLAQPLQLTLEKRADLFGQPGRKRRRIGLQILDWDKSTNLNKKSGKFPMSAPPLFEANHHEDEKVREMPGAIAAKEEQRVEQMEMDMGAGPIRMDESSSAQEDNVEPETLGVASAAGSVTGVAADTAANEQVADEHEADEQMDFGPNQEEGAALTDDDGAGADQDGVPEQGIIGEGDVGLDDEFDEEPQQVSLDDVLDDHDEEEVETVADDILDEADQPGAALDDDDFNWDDDEETP